MSFKLSDFIAAPSQELLDKAKKSDLLDIADHYGLSNIKTSMLKHEIKNILIQFFVDEEIFEEFKRCINSDVKAFLNEREVENLETATRLADDYALTHKASFVNKPYPRKPYNPQSKQITPQSKPYSPQSGPKANPSNPTDNSSPKPKIF